MAIVLVPLSASALGQGKHRGISYSACSKQKLPNAFCTAVGAAAYNVDHFEWDDLAAHAQPEAGEGKCSAAEKTVGRVATLAAEIRKLGLSATQYDPALAAALGRVLHTVQDNCAHSGMPNVQHAWASVSDSCTDSESSPDVQPQAIACAEAETAVVMEAFAAQFTVPSPPSDPDGQTQQDPQYFPPRGGVCDFLKSAGTWDGVDRRWNSPVVVAAVREQLAKGFGGDTSPIDVCASGPSALELLTPAPTADVSQPTAWCTKLKIYCAGKTDDASTAPPWEPSEAAPAAAESSDASGCGLSGPPTTPSGASMMLVALSGFFLRRRPKRH
ncbi:MAG: hypothetical protein HYZ29_03160 [Myxococcales bacterium]|nr:hypothetical protein [Myxococcales bacterium]